MPIFALVESEELSEIASNDGLGPPIPDGRDGLRDPVPVAVDVAISAVSLPDAEAEAEAEAPVVVVETYVDMSSASRMS